MKKYNISKSGNKFVISLEIDINEICKLAEENDFTYNLYVDKY